MKTAQSNLASVFDEQASRSGRRLAVREPGRDWSYQDLHVRSEELSACLGSLGISSGHRVALMLPNSGALVAAFFGIARVGAVVAPFNVRYREQELVYYLRDTAAAALVLAPEMAELARPACAQLDPPPVLIEVNEEDHSRVMKPDRTPSHFAKCDGVDHPLLHQYTSGSTGQPKRIIRTHGQLVCELKNLAQVFALSEQDRFLGAAPFSHVNGLVRTMLTSMYVGGTLFPVPEFKRREVLSLISREKITYFGGVPYLFVILADTAVQGAVDLSSLRTAFSASAPLLADDNRRFAARYGMFVRQLYGSTETGTISVNQHPEPETCLESVGVPLPGVRVEIVDDRGQSLPPGQEGEVAISSPTAITAYEGNPEANAGSFRDGFYLSGDLGRKNADGCLVLTGRKKFLINRGGYKVNPLEVEQAVAAHPKVKEVVVLAAPTRFGDEAVRCVIVARESCTEEEIIRHCQPRIADFKIPSQIEFRDELPKSETGKILRNKL